MKFKSEIVTQASGSIGGTTYAHNRGGLYRRARSIPTNPNSAAQQAVRGNVGALAARWRATLTTTQRAAWSDYAAVSPVTDKLGDPLLLTGQQMYIRSNAPRMRAGASVIDDGPTTPGLTELNGVTATLVTSDVEVEYDNTDAWAGSDDGVLIIQSSRIVAATINFLRSPLRQWASETGSGTTPPISPIALTNNAFGQPFLAFPGQACFFRLIASDGEGRLSPVVTTRVDL